MSLTPPQMLLATGQLLLLFAGARLLIKVTDQETLHGRPVDVLRWIDVAPMAGLLAEPMVFGEELTSGK